MTYDWRLSRLESNMKDLELMDTKIDWNCLTERERILFRKCFEVRDKYGGNIPTDVLTEVHPLFLKAGEIIWRRAFNLWMEVVDTSFRNDFEKALFWVRFAGWVRETTFIIDRMRFEDEDLKRRFGENADEWPWNDEPQWKEHEKAVEDFEREYKKDWEKEDKRLFRGHLNQDGMRKCLGELSRE